MITVKWLSYELYVYTINTNWNDDVGGIYIFSGPINNNQWVAYYIGQTDSFKDRLPNHERWEEAKRLGATHVHAMVVRQEATREDIERELIRAFQPRLNLQLKESYSRF
jgi:excinuclease UvrABC nuclease subunit